MTETPKSVFGSEAHPGVGVEWKSTPDSASKERFEPSPGVLYESGSRSAASVSFVSSESSISCPT